MDAEKREELRCYLEGLVKRPVSPTVIHAIKVNPLYHGSSPQLIEVGGRHADMEPDAPLETVLAIFESKSFLVVTEERGHFSGLPYIFTREEVRNVDKDRS